MSELMDVTEKDLQEISERCSLVPAMSATDGVYTWHMFHPSGMATQCAMALGDLHLPSQIAVDQPKICPACLDFAAGGDQRSEQAALRDLRKALDEVMGDPVPVTRYEGPTSTSVLAHLAMTLALAAAPDDRTRVAIVKAAQLVRANGESDVYRTLAMVDVVSDGLRSGNWPS